MTTGVGTLAHEGGRTCARFRQRLLLLALALSPASSEPLPQDHPYQKSLRDWLQTLEAHAFEVELKPFTPPQEPLSDAQRYRYWVLLQSYGNPDLSGLALLPEQFTLQAIEGGDAVRLPTLNSIGLAWLAGWEEPGNPYRGAPAVKLRAFVHTAIDLVMLDQLHERRPEAGANRSDYLGGTLIWLAYNYGRVKDALPQPARQAYEGGLKKMVFRLNQWGPKGLMTDMDLFAPVGLHYAWMAMPEDPEVESIAEDYSRRLFTQEKYFHPAGYFVDNGCFDVSYNGISLFFNAWIATISDWPFVRAALEKAYRLRSHLTFPEPGGGAFGPSHLSSRTSADSPGDQWGFTHRHVAAAMATDEALSMAPMLSRAELDQAPARLYSFLNSQLKKPESPEMKPWVERHWTAFPNFAYDHFEESFFTRLARLREEKSPLLKVPMERSEIFVRNFENTILVARFEHFGVAIHTGPVGWGHEKWKRPYGFGGGALSAFWTPASGTMVLGRRRGIQGSVWDSFDEWRSWPTHALSGQTKAGGIFSSALIRHPKAQYSVKSKTTKIEVKGQVPDTNIAQGKVLNGTLAYYRRFSLSASGLRVTTQLKTNVRDDIAELYEIIPIFRSPSAAQADPALTRIEFREGKEGQPWREASPTLQPAVTHVQVLRPGGGVLISMDKPRRVRLSDADWTDGFQSQVVCRNILIDLTGKELSRPRKGLAELTWTVTPLTPDHSRQSRE